ncbi:MAG: GspE/PulE family protein [Pseudomonadota bacterium]
MSAPPKKIHIGDLLVKKGIITPEQLIATLAEQKTSGRKFGQVLIRKQIITEQQLLDFLSQQFGLSYIDLCQFRVDRDIAQTLSETQARRFRALVLSHTPDGSALVGMVDPSDLFALDEMARLLCRPIQPAVVRESDLLASIDTLYRKNTEISNIAQELGEELAETHNDSHFLGEADGQTNAPVVRLLKTLFEDATRAHASDIHIEPGENDLRIRLRIDGFLKEQVMNEKRIAAAVVSRLKLVAGLDISEKRLPQDGRFHMKVSHRGIDVRISTLPIQYGESVVMRLLDVSSGALDLDSVGMPPDLLKRFRAHVQRPHGMVLVTGPTGSGKTTTIYGALQELNTPERKIITAEDPVEYRLPRVNQVQINPKIGLTFANILRSALRQDPDVLLVGEMRDQETAEMGLRAAMTGHFVLSTLHTNDAVSTAMRLLDMGADGFLVAASLNAVLAQRLIRRLCDNCTRPAPLTEQTRVWLNGFAAGHLDKPFRKGNGCHLCNNTGYKGRIGVFELLEIDETLGDTLRRNDQAGFSHAAKAQGFRSLAACALDYALAGMTSLDEVVRLVGETYHTPVSSTSTTSEIP